MSDDGLAGMLLQVWIAATGLGAIALLQFGRGDARRWAPFIGLAGQPAWLWHAVDADALGIGMVSAVYTVMWIAGCVKEMRG